MRRHCEEVHILRTIPVPSLDHVHLPLRGMIKPIPSDYETDCFQCILLSGPRAGTRISRGSENFWLRPFFCPETRCFRQLQVETNQ